MNKIIILIIPILGLFSSISEAQIGKAVEKTLGAAEADLTKTQLRNCIILQNQLNEQAKILKQTNSELKTLKEEIDKRSSYIEEKRSQAKTMNNKQITELNNVITKQKQVIGSYNNKVDSSKTAFNNYQTSKETFNTDCAEKSYYASDMESVTAELEKVKKNKYSLTINLIPADGKIRIMNIGPKYTPGILLKPGKYDVYITRSGHSEYRKWIEIKDSDINLDIVLQKK